MPPQFPLDVRRLTEITISRQLLAKQQDFGRATKFATRYTAFGTSGRSLPCNTILYTIVNSSRHVRNQSPEYGLGEPCSSVLMIAWQCNMKRMRY